MIILIFAIVIALVLFTVLRALFVPALFLFGVLYLWNSLPSKEDLFTQPHTTQIGSQVTQGDGQITSLLALSDDLNKKCRDGRGDTEANLDTTLKECSKRDDVGGQLEKMGWCWGRKGQAEYQRYWQVCTTD